MQINTGTKITDKRTVMNSQEKVNGIRITIWNGKGNAPEVEWVVLLVRKWMWRIERETDRHLSQSNQNKQLLLHHSSSENWISVDMEFEEVFRVIEE